MRSGRRKECYKSHAVWEIELRRSLGVRRREKMARHSRDFRNATAMRRAEKRRFAIARLGLINRKHAECRKSERASEQASQAVSTLQPAEQMGERCDGVRIVVVAVIDYREIIKRSRPRRAKKSHLTARGQRDTVGTTVCPVKTCKAASLSGRNIPWRNK